MPEFSLLDKGVPAGVWSSFLVASHSSYTLLFTSIPYQGKTEYLLTSSAFFALPTQEASVRCYFSGALERNRHSEQRRVESLMRWETGRRWEEGSVHDVELADGLSQDVVGTAKRLDSCGEKQEEATGFPAFLASIWRQMVNPNWEYNAELNKALESDLAKQLLHS